MSNSIGLTVGASSWPQDRVRSVPACGYNMRMAKPPLLDRLRKEKLTLLVEDRGGLCFASDRPGLRPLRQAVFEHPELLDGGDVALPSVGLAAAYLLIFGKIGRVLTGVMTYDARRAFDEEGIEYHAGSHARKLGADDPMAEFDPQAKEAVTGQAFVEELKRQVL